MKDWKMPVSGIQRRRIEGVLTAATGKNWFCLEQNSIVRTGTTLLLNLKPISGKRAGSGRPRQLPRATCTMTEYMNHKPLKGQMKPIDDPVVIMPRFLFTSMMASLTKTMG